MVFTHVYLDAVKPSTFGEYTPSLNAPCTEMSSSFEPLAYVNTSGAVLGDQREVTSFPSASKIILLRLVYLMPLRFSNDNTMCRHGEPQWENDVPYVS